MPYLPPTGTVDLSLIGDYSPPTGTVNLTLGTGVIDRDVWIAGATATPSGQMGLQAFALATLAGTTVVPTGALVVKTLHRFTLAGATVAPTGALAAGYDPNLLSAVHAVIPTAWQEGAGCRPGIIAAFQPAQALFQGQALAWQPAPLAVGRARPTWQPASSQSGATIPRWQTADPVRYALPSRWQGASRLIQSAPVRWQLALPAQWTTVSHWLGAPRLGHARAGHWQDGAHQDRSWRDYAGDGRRLIAGEIEVWQPAGTPGNATNPPKDPIPPIFRPPWGTRLRLLCPLPGLQLRIGRTPCILIAESEIPDRRSYMTTNSASLVRWPDLTPLPVTSMTVETDFDSWCWSLTATLAGADAWALVQPNPLACEVQATINGQVWRFLLDVPSTNRSFNSDRVSLKGRSRSAWLHDPYTVSRDFSEENAREMQQLGEAALANTGWTLDWQLENWVVPAGRYTLWNTPIGVLIRLANTTDDGVYTHPSDQVMTLHPRWPVASWLLDAETADIALPESALLSLAQNPVYTPPLNGVYLSGTSHGALALVKITGTDGALQPPEPITDELLCDEAGVAARQRGLNALSDSGAGWEMDAETLFNPTANPAFPLVPPGQIVSLAGLKGISRSCRISAQWSGNGLSVRQSVGLERREIDA